MKQTRLSSSLTSWNVHSLQIAKRKKKQLRNFLQLTTPMNPIDYK